MKPIRFILLMLLILLNSLMAAGCWNYREIDQLAVVAGIAIDKGADSNFIVTVEIVEIGTGKESETKSKTLAIQGKTLFDAARHGISSSGKRLYWSHAKVVVISKDIAAEGIMQILDWFNRDAETRGDIHILVSKGESAKEVLLTEGIGEKVVSYELDNVLKNQKSLSNAPHIEVWKFTNELTSRGVGTITPVVDIQKEGEVMVPHVMGTAIFKSEKLLGFIDGEETKDMLFVRDEVKGGVLVVEAGENEKMDPVSLEIFKNKTKLETVIENGEIQMNVRIETTVAVDEISGTYNILREEEIKKLEQKTETMLKSRITRLVKKVQSEFGVDVFGFGQTFRQDQNKVWHNIEQRWENMYRDLQVNVEVKVRIKNSAMLSKPLEVAE